MKIIQLFRHYIMPSFIATLLLGGMNSFAYAATESDTLVVYLSRTQNNKVLAEFIAKTTSGDLEVIETATPYPQNYPLMRDQVVRELADGTFPALKNQLNTDRYHRIIIVFPTWSMRLPPPIKTFLVAHNLANKVVMPLNTNAGYGVGTGFDEIKQLAVNADVRIGLSLQGGNEREGRLFVMQGEVLTQAQTKIAAWLEQEGKD